MANQANADSFETRWLHRQHECGQDDLGPQSFVKCREVVLPSSAAPFVSFNEADKQPRLWEVFGPTSAWSVSEKNRVAGYRMIGSDGCGNPICLEEKTGAVWMLDHEDYFRTRQFVNSNVELLAECLLVCMGEQNGGRLIAAIQKLDSPAAAHQSFWDEASISLNNTADIE